MEYDDNDEIQQKLRIYMYFIEVNSRLYNAAEKMNMHFTLILFKRLHLCFCLIFIKEIKICRVKNNSLSAYVIVFIKNSLAKFETLKKF